jgi:hypothetical protein
MTELWILSSHRVWQYFRILPGSIGEIREDGAEITETGTTDLDSP